MPTKQILKDQPSTKKKITFFSSVLLVIGSCIGAGIFFKNDAILTNTHDSIVLSVIAWLVAIFGILCISLTLADLVKGSGAWNSLGIIGWIRGFCKTGWYKGFRNFMMFIYLPTNFFFMPYYSIQSLQDALHIFGTDISNWLVILLSAIVMIYFVTTCGISTKLASVQNNIVTYVKFLPLIFAFVVGFIIFITHNGHPLNPVWPITPAPPPNPVPKTLIQYSATLGIIASIPAIFFAFDGFYAASASTHELKEPEKSSLGMALGIAIVAAIYVLISLGMLLGSPGGGIDGFIHQWETSLWWKIICGTMSLFIVFAVFGVINGFALYGFAFYRSLIKFNEAPFSRWINQKMTTNKNHYFIWYTLILYACTFILLTVIGCFYYNHMSTDYGNVVNRIYSFCDLISNWTSLFVFVALGIAVMGALHKKTHKLINIKQPTRYFILFAIISIALIFLSSIYETTSTIFDLIITIQYQQTYTDVALSEYLIPAILQTLTLLIFVLIVIYPLLKEENRQWTQPPRHQLW